MVTMDIRTILSLCFILLSSAYHPLPCDAATTKRPVRDNLSDEMRSYFTPWILPAIRLGGGVTMEVGKGKNNTSRSTGVVLDRDITSTGTKVGFVNIQANTTYIPVSTDMNFRFKIDDIYYFWKVGPYDSKKNQSFVTTGGVEGDRSPKGIGSWFRIEENGYFYHIRYCPTVCRTCRITCRNIGIVDDNGVKRLALNDIPFKFFFRWW